MSNVIEPKVVKFSNHTIRPTATRLWELYWAAKEIESLYFSQGINGVLDAAAGADFIQDGAAPIPANGDTPAYNGDGRTPISAGDMQSMIGILQAFVTTVEAQGRLGVVGKIQTGGG